MKLPITIISLIENLLLLLPALLAVAYVTVAERKTMASMQRRLGPNAVGYRGLLQALKLIFIYNWMHLINNIFIYILVFKSKLDTIIFNKHMSYKNSFSLQHKHLYSTKYNNNKSLHLTRFYSTNVETCYIKDLYKDRLAPVKPFSEELLTTCSNLLDLKERVEFFQNLKEKGGIYIFQYKFDPMVYYIGRTTSFNYRLKYHINHKLTDKFHVFGNLVGWDNFYVSVVEICNKEDSGVRENYYLQKYLPLLNSTFSSNFSDSNIFETLTSKLKAQKYANSDVSIDISDGKYKGVQIWNYKLLETKIDEQFIKYSSINNASSALGIGRSTINLYLDTNVPIKELLFFSKPIEDFSKSFELANKLKDELNLNSNISKKVWVYSIDASQENKLVLVNDQPFNSRESAAKFLETTHKVVRYFMDSWEGKAFKGYYLFSKPLTEKELNSLLKICLSKPKPENSKVIVWAYNADTLNLIGSFPSMQKAADNFNVDYRTISNNLDTELATKQNDTWIYLFTDEISDQIKNKLLKDLKKVSNATTEVWVYKNLNGELILFDENQPFKSRLQASKILKMSHKTIIKHTDTNVCYKDLYFYSKKI